MKSIRVLIDTNIVLDWLMCRKPFQEHARFIMEKCLFGDLDGYLTAHSISDLFYILRKDFDVNKRKKLLLLGLLMEAMNRLSVFWISTKMLMLRFMR